MDTSTEYRWIELQFYYICADLLKINNNLMDIMDVIDSLAVIGHYAPEHIKNLAQEAISSIRLRPSKEEFVLLCHLFHVPIQYIKDKTQLHNRTLYQILADDKSNPRTFYPRFQPNQILMIKKFVDCFNIIRKAGLPHDR